ncbi:hypothetical protein [Acinetobacter sp. NyZ410]|nr:hypothetical protein [Acinetobacter sp. NyZ410]UOH20606.1 hypothetical protein MTO68_10775 [Acinetobacter sp. NyZ410]
MLFKFPDPPLNVATANGSANLDFYARYYATGATTAGDVSTTATYYVVYQ